MSELLIQACEYAIWHRAVSTSPFHEQFVTQPDVVVPFS